MEINIPEIPEVIYQLKYYKHGEWVHDVEVDYFDTDNGFDAQEIIERNTPDRDKWKEVEIVQKEALGYQVRCYDEDSLADVYVVTIEPFLKYKHTKFKLVQV
jgi:hypothetical protein